MASDTAFLEPLQAFDAQPQPVTPSTRGKRKRTPGDNTTPARAAPASKRNDHSQSQPNQASSGSHLPQMTNVNENGGNFIGDGGAQFGLQNLDNGMNRQDDSNNVDTAAAALNYSMQVPDFSAASAAEGQEDNNFGGLAGPNNTNDVEHQPAGDQAIADFPESPAPPEKPAVGTEEWTRMRKDNHKEVERRRREAINEGINDLTKIVPGCEKNKGAVLARAVQYIHQLQDEASQKIDKWTFEKLVTEQAIQDLSTKLHRAWAEKLAWKKLAREAGVEVDNVDLGLDNEEPKDADENAERRRAKSKTSTNPEEAEASAE